MDATAPESVLHGLRVLELGTLIAGPFCGRLLADHGADVIKIEAPDRPDPLREWGQAEKDCHHFWTVHARNKRCVTLDLRKDEGRELFLRPADTADVVVESFRPGTLERWGLGYDVLAERNPGLVLARVSAYGQTGPHSQRPGYASVAESVGGMRSLNGFRGGPPPRAALSLGDSLGGMFAYQGVLAAVHARDRTGGPRKAGDRSSTSLCQRHAWRGCRTTIRCWVPTCSDLASCPSSPEPRAPCDGPEQRNRVRTTPRSTRICSVCPRPRCARLPNSASSERQIGIVGQNLESCPVWSTHG